jgi:hypothetical protein
MAIKKYKKSLKEFDAYLQQKGSHRGKTQTVVEYYRFLTQQFDTLNWKFPFSRHLRAAHKILTWANGEVEKTEGLIFDFWHYYKKRNLRWNLDTAYRNIPQMYDCDQPDVFHQHDHVEQNSSEWMDLLGYETKAVGEWLNKPGAEESERSEMVAKAREEFFRSLDNAD